ATVPYSIGSMSSRACQRSCRRVSCLDGSPNRLRLGSSESSCTMVSHRSKVIARIALIFFVLRLRCVPWLRKLAKVCPGTFETAQILLGIGCIIDVDAGVQF